MDKSYSVGQPLWTSKNTNSVRFFGVFCSKYCKKGGAALSIMQYNQAPTKHGYN